MNNQTDFPASKDRDEDEFQHYANKIHNTKSDTRRGSSNSRDFCGSRSSTSTESNSNDSSQSCKSCNSSSPSCKSCCWEDEVEQCGQRHKSIFDTREHFRHFFKTLTPAHAAKIRILSRDDRSVLQWSGNFDYRLFVCAYVVGLGDLIYFPLRCIRYGTVAFSIAYIIMYIVIGYPLLLMEAGFGQFCSYGPGGCWEFAKLLQGFGYVAVMRTGFNYKFIFHKTFHWLMYTYHMVYIYPWEQTREELIGQNQTKDIGPSRTLESEINEVHVLRGTGNIQTGGEMYILYAVNWVVVILLLIPSIRIRGRIISTLFVLFAISIFLICVRALALPGAITGIKYGLFHDSGNSLLNYEIWISAFHQCFFSLGLAPGHHMTLASYNHFNNQIVDDVFCFVCVDSFFNCVGFVMIFSFLGNLMKLTTIEHQDINNLTKITTIKLEDIENVKAEQLLHTLMPYSLSKYGFVWVIFFLTAIYINLNLYLTSELETFITGIMDVFKLNKSTRRYVVLSTCGVLFIFFLWMCTEYNWDILTLLQFYVGDQFWVVLSLCFLCSVLYVFGVGRYLSMLECCVGWYNTPILSNRWWKRWWKACWNYMIPSIFVAVLIHGVIIFVYHPQPSEKKPFETWMLIIGRSIWALFVLCLFGSTAYYIATTDEGGFISRLRFLTTPTPKWGPMLPQNRYIVEVGDEDRYKEKIEKKKMPITKQITDFSQLMY